jgi:serine/threonine protein kinase
MQSSLKALKSFEVSYSYIGFLMPIQFGPDLLLLERLASGGMADVFRAKHLGTGGFQKTVAIKRILPHYASRLEFKSMFEREMNLCANMQHPNIAQVYSNGEHAGYLYLLMEFVDGKNASELLAKSRELKIQLPISIVCHIISEIAKGLDYAHKMKDESGKSLDIIHRDISPHNIMLGYNGDVKLVDFGIAKAADRAEVSKTGDLKGKILYASPESINGLKLDQRTDIFSLGNVFYELLTQKTLFGGESTFEVMNNVRECKVPSLEKHGLNVPKELEETLRCALEEDREKRYQTAYELHRDLAFFINRSYPQFVSTDFSKFMQDLFKAEIERVTRERRAMSSAIVVDTNSGISREGGSESLLAGGTSIVPVEEASKLRSSSGFSSVVGKTGGSSLGNRGSGSLSRGSGLFFPNEYDDQIPSEETERYRVWIILSLFMAIIAMGLGAYLLFYKQTLVRKDILPPAVPQLLAWYDVNKMSSNVGVAKWENKLGDKFPLTQQYTDLQPMVRSQAINGLGTIHFDGRDDYLIGDDLVRALKLTKSMSILYVAKAEVDKTHYIWSMHGADRLYDIARSGFARGRSARIKATNKTGQYFDSSQVVVNQFAIYSVVIDQKKAQMFRNGVQIIDSSIQFGVLFDETGFFTVGQEWDGPAPTDLFEGDLAEFIVYSEAISENDRKNLESYLSKKYAIKVSY